MESDIEQLLQTELEYIYTYIVAKALSDENGTYWIADTIDGSDKFSETVYCGSSGILLFLIEYYSYTKNQQVLDLIKRSANWLINYCKKNPTKNFSFYTGRIGTVYTLIKAYKLANNESAIQDALSLLDDIKTTFNNDKICCDFLNGISGTLLGLLHIFDILKQDFIKEHIAHYASLLIENINVREYGFFWDKTARMSKPWCGFSHGPSGVAFVFLELGTYFNDDFFYSIAKKGIEYEDHFYSPIHNNWPDFRKGFYDTVSKDKHIKQFVSGNYNYFEAPSYMKAWCHGSPGVGLTRLKAHKVFEEEKYSEEILKSIDSVLNSTNNPPLSATLCHGILGNSALFLEFHKQTKDPKYLQYFLDDCQKAIRLKQKEGFYRSGLNDYKHESLNLFLGICGIGYSFLQALNPFEVFAPLSPGINSSIKERLGEFNCNSPIRANCKKRFPYTFSLIGERIELKEFNYINFKDVKFKLLEKYIEKGAESELAYHIETKKLELEIKMRSYSLYNIQKIQNLNNFIEGQKLNFKSSTLLLNPDVCFYEENEKILLLYPDVTEYKFAEIDSNTKDFLKKLESKTSFLFIYSQFRTNDNKEIKLFLKQMESFIRSGILLIM